MIVFNFEEHYTINILATSVVYIKTYEEELLWQSQSLLKQIKK